MEVEGKIKVIGAEIQVNPTFRKKELVITTDSEYPQSIMIEFTQDKADLLNNFSVGQNVVVGINLGGREWVNPQGETKYFNSIKGWKIAKQDTSKQSPVANTSTTQTNPQQAGGTLPGEDDEMPF